MEKKLKMKVGVVAFPMSHEVPLSNLIKLFLGITNKVYVISGGEALEKLKDKEKVRSLKVTHRISSNALMRIINYVSTQLKILQYVVTVSKEVDLFVFFIGGEGLLIPILALKLLRKKILLMPGGIANKVYSVRKDPISKFMSLLVSINFTLTDTLIVYSHRLIREANLARYQHKIAIAHEHFVDFTKFAIKKKVDERSNLVGYIGRLSEEKGILNLIEAMPLVLKKKADAQFIICGQGRLAHEVEKIIKARGLEANVKLTGWIPHEDVPRYLNELKILVLPSFTEGLPNILLEAMACRTPVLATTVGAIPDIIKDGKNGFLLKTNDPRHIAERIIELLNKPDLLEKVSINAYNYVRENFSYEKTLEAWRKILSELELSK